MATAHSSTRRSGRQALGPHLLFAVALAAIVAAGATAARTGSDDLVLPAVSTAALILGLSTAIVVWPARGLRAVSEHVSYWDVAGALTLIGIFAGAFIDPDQMVRILEGTSRRP